MRPILLQGHERALTQIRYTKDGDILFSTAKDQIICAWFSANGERLGTYHGHQGALWTVDVDPTTTLLASGAADNTVRLWDVRTGKCIKVWEFNTAVKRVEFSEDGTQLLAVTEKRMGYLGTIVVLDIKIDVNAEQSDERSLTITCDESKATVAGWSYLSKYIIAGHEDGSVSQYDAKNGENIHNTQAHEVDMQVTDLQWSPDRTYFITSSKDKTAKIISARTLEVLKTYVADTPLNTAAITPKKDFVILGGGQAAMDVTTTSSRQGKFEARFYHRIFEDEIGRVKGHFGPLNTVAVDPQGRGYASGGEDGYVRVHHFDKGYFDFMYEVEPSRSDGADDAQDGAENGTEKPAASMWKRIYKALKEILFSSWANVLLVFVPAGIACKVARVKPTIIFAMNALAIVPLAGLLSSATESVAHRLGNTKGALLNVSFGNTVELIIFMSVSALQAILVGF
ncbi:MAG: hypothetical protein Q9173_006062 [Seirophora scorigena]